MFKGSAVKSATKSNLKILSVVLFLSGMLVAAVGCTSTVEAPPKIEVGVVSLSIDFPDDVQRTDIDAQVGCSADATVFEVLQRAQTDGVLEFEYSINAIQESASVFVRTIGGVGDGESKFWTVYVNGELAKEGCGTCPVKPGDKIRWVFGEPPADLL